jgi:hypothetical protein
VSPSFVYNTSDSSQKWSLVGRVTLALGARFVLRLSGGSGYNADNAQLNLFTMLFSNSNSTNFLAGTNSSGNFYGNGVCYSHGPNATPSNVRIVQETASSVYAIYFYIGGFTGNNIVEASGGDFTFVNTTLSAFPSGVTYIEPPIYTMLHTNNYASNIANNSLSIAMVNNLQSSLNLLAPLAGPTFTGTPSAPTATVTTNTTQIATTQFVQTRARQYGTTSNTAGTLNASDAGCLVYAGAGIIVAQNLTANQFVKVYNNTAASITITQGSGLTLRLSGTTTTGHRTLAVRGVCEILYLSSTEAVVSGTAVS